MIQIREAKSWGYPSFVKGVYWHSDYSSECKWGGVLPNGEPCSNTKKWVSLHHRIKGNGISCVFVLGGGSITMDEVKVAKRLDIPIHYIPIERRFHENPRQRYKGGADRADVFTSFICLMCKFETNS